MNYQGFRLIHLNHPVFLSLLMQRSQVKVCNIVPLEVLYLNNVKESVVSTSSKLTSSDKLSALPATSSPPLGRIRTPTPVIRQGADHTDSLPSLISPSPPFGSTDLPPIGHHSLSEGSLGMQTSKQRVSFDSDRGSLSSIKNFRQSKPVSFKHLACILISYYST